MKQGSDLEKELSEIKKTNNPAYIPNLEIEKVVPNPYQPRMRIDEAKLKDLAQSIKETGVIEPLIVTKGKEGNYEIIAGERRWKASILAGLKTIPVIIKEATPQQMLELAVIENIQRADLNPLEEAIAFKQLIDQFSMSQALVAQKVGLSRPAVTNKIRLLELPKDIREGLLSEIITEGHARALQGLTGEQALLAAYRKVLKETLSVRATEELVRRLNIGLRNVVRHNNVIMDETSIKIEVGLQKRFANKKVKLSRSLRGGRIVIPFNTDKQLSEILDKISIEID